MSMLKSLSICAAAFLLVGCEIPSRSLKEERAACIEWMNKYDLHEDGFKVSKRRGCVLEKETNQWLGTESYVVVKHFRY